MIEFSSEELECIEQSFTCWDVDKLTAHCHSTTTNAFLRLVTQGYIEQFDNWKKHSFWLNWRSKKSKLKKSLLYVAAYSSIDVRWIGLLISLGLPVNGEEGARPPIISSFSSSRPKMLPALEAFLKNGATVSDIVLKEAARAGSWQCVEKLIDLNFFPVRILGVESLLLQKKFLDEKLKQTDFQTAFDKLSLVWGEMDGESLHDIWTKNIYLCVPKPTSAQQKMMKIIEKKWNPLHPYWSDADYYVFLEEMIRTNKNHAVIDKINEHDWIFPKSSLDRIRSFFPQQAQSIDEIHSYNENAILRQILKDKSSLAINRSSFKM